jgi:DNA-binding response OmpR family regulator
MPPSPFDPLYVADEFSKGKPPSPWTEDESSGSLPARPRILVVDDQKLIVDTLAEILEVAGYEVMPAYDGWTALDLAGKSRPDYLLSDILMPRLNGIQLAIAMRKMHPGVRILLFSGQAGVSEILDEGEAQGYRFDILGKPIHPRKLIERLKELP